MTKKRTQEFFRGCLIGGAIGDALGWPVEFLSYNEIIKRFGEGGIKDLVVSSSGKAEITDDTQMTLFTAEGLLRAQTKSMEKGSCHPPTVVYFAYQRWLHTQGYPKIKELDWIYDGWLVGVKELHARRAPGSTCIDALLSQQQGTINNSINSSKGCGGVMRSAPVGLFCPIESVFDWAAEIAALTHGHPSGYLSAGALAYIVASIISGEDINTAVYHTLTVLSEYENHEECTHLLQQALDFSNRRIPDVDAITQLGQGWVGEEALAISIYCALKYQDDFRKAVIAAANHNGDSDSTASITGNILGAYLGLSYIPSDWLEKVELKEVLIQVADDLLIGYQGNQEWRERYPGN